ncbi:MAG: peroxiredoxin, partial [Erythrobacteraceae bacterium]|nr:peroxiredoxin [Erythrobacteraceae bacterium]
MTTTYGEGDDFPEFEMETPDGGTVTKADLSGKKAVIFFYPKDNTPGCTTEAKDFSALKAAFDKADVSLLGVSKDSAKKHQNFIAKHDLT